MISYKLGFYRNLFHLDTRSDLHLATAQLSDNKLDQTSPGNISNLITLLNVKAGLSVHDNFNWDQIYTMIDYLSTD